MRLTKHHGLGNDFLVLAGSPHDGETAADAALAVAVCDRHRGVGADGLLHLGSAASGGTVSMVLRNADGSRAEMSGNGIGCLVQAAVLAGLASPPEVVVRTDAGLRTVAVTAGEAPRTHVVSVGMGAPVVGDADVAAAWAREPGVHAATLVSVGNPHLVLHADADRVADRAWVEALGARANAAIAGGVNVEAVAVEGGGLAMDVYERGVGLTLACGTGATAAAFAAHGWGLVGPVVDVRMAGGTTTVDLASAEARLTTPIVHVADVEYPWP